jgi:stage II sporulation protein GA (sporulation sigma-E factor processing peptidase)
MVLLAFGGSRRLLRLVIVFFCLSFALAGGVLAIGLMGGKGLLLKNGVLYSAMDVKIIALSAAGCYVIFTAVFQRVAKQVKGREVLPAVLRYGERKVTLLVLVDTGNTLSDPVTGRPVLVADFENVAPLLPDKVNLSVRDLSDPVKTLQRLAEQGVGNSFRLLNYQAVGVECAVAVVVVVGAAEEGNYCMA